jgi:hypothetical protein
MAEGATAIGLVPVAWLALLRWRGRSVEPAYWWIAGALGVSFLADTVARWVNPFVVSLAYPVAQCGLLGATLLERKHAWRFLGLLLVAAALSAIQKGMVDGPDMLLHTVAWLGVACIVAPQPALARLALALWVGFGVAWVAWIAYALRPGLATWGMLQGARLEGAALFCWAASYPDPRLQVIRAKRAA